MNWLKDIGRAIWNLILALCGVTARRRREARAAKLAAGDPKTVEELWQEIQEEEGEVADYSEMVTVLREKHQLTPQKAAELFYRYQMRSE